MTDRAWHHHLPGMRLGLEDNAICEVIDRQGNKQVGHYDQLDWTGVERYRVVPVVEAEADPDTGQDI